MNTAVVATPKIGEAFEGGIYAGITLHQNAPMHLVLLPGAAEDLRWKNAIDWAKEQGGELPSRIDALVLFDNLPKKFERDYYWTAAPYAGHDALAWAQDFGYGSQYLWGKHYEFRARAVRRFSLTDSIIQ
jgi:hypothetical protein